MLIDNNQDEIFFNERMVNKCNAAEMVVSKQLGRDAITYLKTNLDQGQNLYPDLIFLDINMPGMNGWEFLDEYSRLDEKVKTGTKIIMLTTSDSPDDKLKAKQMNIACDFRTKPLTKKMLEELVEKFSSPPPNKRRSD